jgi:hypothetical protein
MRRAQTRRRALAFEPRTASRTAAHRGKASKGMSAQGKDPRRDAASRVADHHRLLPVHRQVHHAPRGPGNCANPTIGSGMQQARQAMRGSNRRSREKRQWRIAREGWHPPAGQRTDRPPASAGWYGRSGPARETGADAHCSSRWRGTRVPVPCARYGLHLGKPHERKLAAGAAVEGGSQTHLRPTTSGRAAHRRPNRPAT